MSQNISACSNKTQTLEHLEQKLNFSNDKVRQLQQRATIRLEQGKQTYQAQYNTAIREQLLLSEDVLENLRQLQREWKLEKNTVEVIQQQIDREYESDRQRYEKACLEHLCHGFSLAELNCDTLRKNSNLKDASEIKNLEAQAKEEFETKRQSYRDAFDTKLRQNNLNSRIRAEILASMSYPRLNETCLRAIEEEVRPIFERDKKAYQQVFGDVLCNHHKAEPVTLQVEQARSRFGDDLARSLEQEMLSNARTICRQEILKKLLHQDTLEPESQQQLHHLREWKLLGDAAATIQEELTQAIATYEAVLTQFMQTHRQAQIEELAADDRAILDEYRLESGLPTEATDAIEQRLCAHLQQAQQQQRQDYQNRIQQYETALQREYQKPQPDQDFLRNFSIVLELDTADQERTEATVRQQLTPPTEPIPIPEEPVSQPIVVEQPPSPEPVSQPHTRTFALPQKPEEQKQPLAKPTEWWKWAAAIAVPVVAGVIGVSLYQQWQADQTAQKQLEVIRQGYAKKAFELCLRDASDFPQNSRFNNEVQGLKVQCRNDKSKEFLQQAQREEKKGSLAAAIETASKVDPDAPVYPTSQQLIKRLEGRWLLLAKGYYLEQGNLQGAIDMLRRISKDHPDYAIAQSMLPKLQPEWDANQKALNAVKQELKNGSPYKAKDFLQKIKTTWQGKPVASLYWKAQASPHLKTANKQIQEIARARAEAEAAAAQRVQEQPALPDNDTPTNPYPVNPYPVNPYPVNPYPVNPYPVNPYPVNPYPITPPPAPQRPASSNPLPGGNCSEINKC
jgi:hypothetical protein